MNSYSLSFQLYYNDIMVYITGQSLLERHMSMKLYSRDDKDQFNSNYVTELVRSFRSHPDILEVPNSCFYENELVACADKMQRERFCNWEVSISLCVYLILFYTV